VSAHVRLLNGASVTVDERRELYGATAGVPRVHLRVLSYFDRVEVACTPEQALELAAALTAQAQATRAHEDERASASVAASLVLLGGL
jgi:uncharacterized protein (DUF169 family)